MQSWVLLPNLESAQSRKYPTNRRHSEIFYPQDFWPLEPKQLVKAIKAETLFVAKMAGKIHDHP